MSWRFGELVIEKGASKSPSHQITQSLNCKRLGGVAAAVVVMAAACASEPPRPPTPPTEPVAVKPAHTVGGKVPRATGTSFPSIVLLEPHAPVNGAVPAEPAIIDQLGRTFIPNLVLIRVGQAVEFRNSEHELHNVRVIENATGRMLLNVGLLIGVAHRYTFDRPGSYSVQCDLHPAMFADIIATTTPYGAISDREGKFVLSDVPAGIYDLVVRYGDKTIRRVVQVDSSMAELVVEEDPAPP